MVIMSIVFWHVVQHYIPESSNIKITAIRISDLTMQCAVAWLYNRVLHGRLNVNGSLELCDRFM